jgi:cytochrome c556
MKQVPLVHIGLKRGVEPNRLARQAAQSAGQSASLAAIAQAAMLDDEYAKTPADLEQWVAFCAEMRDAAGQVNSAVHKQDQPAVAAGMKRLAVSCETCHAKFRQP